jgi:MerR family transcriptional regulator, heat shock protein HspR
MTDYPSDDRIPYDEPAYVISVAAKLVCLHPQTLRYYERLGLVTPTRTDGRIRLYSRRNLEMVRKIARLTEDLGVNLAGVEVILNMSERLEELQQEIERERSRARQRIEALQSRVRELEAELQLDRDRPVINVSAREIDPEAEEEHGHDDGPTATVIA